MSKKCEACKDGVEFPFELRTAFQPIVDVESARPYSYEALVRGSAGQTAGEILSCVTEETRYAFDQACRVNAIRDAVKAGLLETDAKLSVNFLPSAVYSPMACLRLTLQTAVETGMPTSRLIFEFTENQRLDTVHVREILRAYRSLGFTTAIDDFGNGHAGLGLLADLATDALKLDMHLIRNIDTCSRRPTIVKSVIELCRELDVLLVAEGIETEAEFETLKNLGIRYMQGHLFAAPEIGVLPTIDLRMTERLAAA
ncbi:MAG: EAL domain-containing protein [Erythrobacter sp.]